LRRNRTRPRASSSDEEIASTIAQLSDNATDISVVVQRQGVVSKKIARSAAWGRDERAWRRRRAAASYARTADDHLPIF